MQNKKNDSKSVKKVPKSPVKKPVKTKTSNSFSILGVTIDKKFKSRVINLVIFKIYPMLSALSIGRALYLRYFRSILKIVNLYYELPPGLQKDYLLVEILGKGRKPHSILQKYIGVEINSNYNTIGMFFRPGIERRIPKEDYKALLFIKSLRDVSDKDENYDLIFAEDENRVVKNIAYNILKIKKK